MGSTPFHKEMRHAKILD
jgi:ankyrin repeat protein